MKILAVETSCDDTSASVVENGRNVLTLFSETQSKTHAKFGGVVPEIASRSHLNSIYRVVQKAIDPLKIDANKSNKELLKKIDALAVTFTPGLIGSLLVGVNFVKGLSISSNLPIIPVNHIKGHVAANFINEIGQHNSGLVPPFLCLMVSGGHTQVINVKTYTDFEIMSQSIDDAVGELFDKVARSMGFPYPGGSVLDELSENGDFEKFKFTIPKLKNYNFSFSGMKTKAFEYVKKIKENEKKDLAASLMFAVFNYLYKNLTELLKKSDHRKIALTGGVSASNFMRKIFSSNCLKDNIEFYFPERKYTTDNAAMIGAQAYFEFLEKGEKAYADSLSFNAYASGTKIFNNFSLNLD